MSQIIHVSQLHRFAYEAMATFFEVIIAGQAAGGARIAILTVRSILFV